MRQKIRIGILASIMLFGIGTAWAGDASYPLVAMTMPRYHVTMRNGRFRADPPPDPTFLNQQQILNQILDLTHGALIVEATASGAPGSPTTFYATDQIFNKVFDAANTALVVNCISGCSGGGGGATLQTNGSSNSSQIVLNFETSTANSAGLTITPSNPSGGIEKFEISGGSYSGNAATATALAATPSQCSGSNFATGIAASGNANCSTPAGGGSAPIPPNVIGSAGSAQTVSCTTSSVAAYRSEWTMTLSANLTLTLTQPSSGVCYITMRIQQAASGGPYTVTWPTSNNGWPGASAGNLSGVVPVMTSTAGYWDYYTCHMDGTNADCNAGQGYAR